MLSEVCYTINISEVRGLDYYIKGAVEEYLRHNRTILEGLRDQGVFSQSDVESELENIKAKIEKDIETNKAYAMLLMEIEKDKYKDEDANEYVSLTEIARLKNFKNPSYVIQSWLRDRNTVEFLFQWETGNNTSFQNIGYHQIKVKLSKPSFTLTPKIWNEYTSAIGIISKQGNGGGTFAHRDIAIDFYAWVFPKKRYQLIKMISGKAAFIETIQAELEHKHSM